MASSGNGSMIKLAVAAAAAYYAYSKGWLSSLGIGTPAVPDAVAPAAVVPDPNKVTGANTLAGIYGRLVANAKAPAAGLTADGWNFFLNREISNSAPDPYPLFAAAIPGFDRNQLVTAGQYWAVMAPALKTQLGLSGLGFFGGGY